jgi:putative endonuclease
MPHFVYVLQSQKDFGYYIGETSDLEARLAYHNAGIQRSTKGRRPFIAAYYELHPNRSSALKREKELKSWKGGIRFKMLLEGSSPAQRGTTFGT